MKTCSFQVPVDIPPGATTGIYTNTSSAFTYDLGGSSVTANAPTASLEVTVAPVISVNVTPSPVLAGNKVTLEFEAENISALAVSDLAMAVELTPGLPFGLVVTFPVNTCGGTPTYGTVPGTTDRAQISYSGGTIPAIPANGTCSFTAEVTLPAEIASQTLSYTLDSASATVGSTVNSSLPSFDIAVLGSPAAIFEMPNGIKPGGSGNIEVTISHDNFDGIPDADNIAFSLDLSTLGVGFTSTVPDAIPFTSACNGSLSRSGQVVSLTGGSLIPGESCNFLIPIDVAGTVTSATYTAATQVTAEYNSSPITGPNLPLELGCVRVRLFNGLFG